MMLMINSVSGVNNVQPNFRSNAKIAQKFVGRNSHKVALKVAGAVAAVGIAIGGGYQWGVASSEAKLAQAEAMYHKAEKLNDTSRQAVEDMAKLAHEKFDEQAVFIKDIVQKAQNEKQARLGLITGLNHVKKISKEPSGIFGWGGYKGTAENMAYEIATLQKAAKIKTCSYEDYVSQMQAQINVANAKIDSIQYRTLGRQR